MHKQSTAIILSIFLLIPVFGFSQPWFDFTKLTKFFIPQSSNQQPVVIKDKHFENAHFNDYVRLENVTVTGKAEFLSKAEIVKCNLGDLFFAGDVVLEDSRVHGTIVASSGIVARSCEFDGKIDIKAGGRIEKSVLKAQIVAQDGLSIQEVVAQADVLVGGGLVAHESVFNGRCDVQGGMNAQVITSGHSIYVRGGCHLSQATVAGALQIKGGATLSNVTVSGQTIIKGGATLHDVQCEQKASIDGSLTADHCTFATLEFFPDYLVLKNSIILQTLEMRSRKQFKGMTLYDTVIHGDIFFENPGHTINLQGSSAYKGKLKYKRNK